MLNIRLQIFLFIIWFVVLFYMIHKIRARHVDIKYILPWIFLDIAMMVLTAFPIIVSELARFFGIIVPSNMLFFFGMIFLTAIVFSLTITVSKMGGEIKTLTQKLALYEEVSNLGDPALCKSDPEEEQRHDA